MQQTVPLEEEEEEEEGREGGIDGAQEPPQLPPNEILWCGNLIWAH